MLIDANLLVYATDTSARNHAAARDWLEAEVGGLRRIGLPWLSLGAFLRLVTNGRVLDRPLEPARAREIVDAWLEAESTWIPAPTSQHAAVLGDLIERHDVRGPLVTDAQLAALAIEHGLTVYSADTDFARFSEVRWVNPLST